MADRRTDETPLAPRRSLAGSSEGQSRTTAEKQSGSDQQQRSGSSSNQQNGSGNAQQQRAGSTPQARTDQQARTGSDQKSGGTGEQRSSTTTEARTPLAGRVNEKLSGAVTAATETVRKAKESRSDERKPGTTTTTAGRPASRPSGGSSRPRTRKARLRMTHVDPWSVMKTAFLLSIALGIVTVIAVAMVWSVLGAAGVWDSINQTVQEVIGGQDGSAFDVENYVGASRVLGFTMIVAVVDVVLITAIATLGAFLYNLAATLLGGIEVTLAEEEH